MVLLDRGPAPSAPSGPSKGLAPAGATSASPVWGALCRQRPRRSAPARAPYLARVSTSAPSVTLRARAVCAPAVGALVGGLWVDAFDTVREGARPAPAWSLAWRLSPRLHDVCALLLLGLADKDIAARLSLSPTSVSTYARQIYRKAGVHTRAELTVAAAAAAA